jgi:hypothetical protein
MTYTTIPRPTPQATAPPSATEHADNGFAWEDPPDRDRPGGRPPRLFTEDIQARLKASPGAWARIRIYPGKKTCGGTAARLKKRSGPGWEIITRCHGDGSAIYARWVGTE